MKISELVAELESFRDWYGDAEVKVYDFGLRDPEMELVDGVCEL